MIVPTVNRPNRSIRRAFKFVHGRRLFQSILHHYAFYATSNTVQVFAETTNVIDSMMGNRQLLTAMENNDDGNFTKELRELRENWRIRKVGQNIYGDLGYKTC